MDACSEYCENIISQYEADGVTPDCFAAEAQQYLCLSQLNCGDRHAAVSGSEAGLPCRLENNINDHFCYDLAFELVGAHYAEACAGLSRASACTVEREQGTPEPGQCFPSGAARWLVRGSADYTTLVCVPN